MCVCVCVRVCVSAVPVLGIGTKIIQVPALFIPVPVPVLGTKILLFYISSTENNTGTGIGHNCTVIINNLAHGVANTLARIE